MSVRIRHLTAVAVLAAVCAVGAPGAQADGDPASDVLLYQSVFPSYFVKVPAADTAELKRVLTEAKARGYTVRVALIGARGDLGAVPSFWGKPQSYAEFLGQELAVLPSQTNYKSRVLVVMPSGFGLSDHGDPVPAEKSELAAVQTPGASGEDLAAGGIRAVQALAAAKGVTIAAKIPGSSGGGVGLPLEIAGGLLALLALGAAVEIGRRRRRSRAS